MYGAGTYVVTMAQPKRGVIRWLLGRTFYPDNSWTRNDDGSPIRPYDMSTDDMAEFMGVRVDPVDTSPTADLAVVRDSVAPHGTVARGSHGYLVDGRLNDAFKAVNLLWDEGVRVRRFVRQHGPHRPGDFWVERRAGRPGGSGSRTRPAWTSRPWTWTGGRPRPSPRAAGSPCTSGTTAATSTRGGRAGSWRTSRSRTRRSSTRS